MSTSTSTSRVVCHYLWEVLAVSPTGCVDVRRTLTQSELTPTVMMEKSHGHDVPVNVVALQTADRTSRSFRAAETGKSIVLTLTPLGRVARVREAEPLANAMQKVSESSSPFSPVFVPALHDFTEKIKATGAPQFATLLPEKPLSPGQTWQQSAAVPGSTFFVSHTYTLTGSKGGVATVSLSGDDQMKIRSRRYHVAPTRSFHGPPNFVYRARGSFEIDETTGLVRRHQMTTTVTNKSDPISPHGWTNYDFLRIVAEVKPVP
jgi:hypothetical protein